MTWWCPCRQHTSGPQRASSQEGHSGEGAQRAGSHEGRTDEDLQDTLGRQGSSGAETDPPDMSDHSSSQAGQHSPTQASYQDR